MNSHTCKQCGGPLHLEHGIHSEYGCITYLKDKIAKQQEALVAIRCLSRDLVGVPVAAIFEIASNVTKNA